ncbi:MAG: DUF488 domain-containing protein [Sedimentisphaerales bacterium]|nr:DUF488 domain-containing protein [Sedimentisphaerales bacterium]
MAGDERALFTIGHSTHELAEFLRLLRNHGVEAVADVRSQPTSRLAHFGRGELADALAGEGIEYVFLGRELGARRDEPECYEDGQAVYERIAELPAFREGLVRVLERAGRQTLALMCAEKEPLDCHRMILVCRRLRGPGIAIRHVLADGTAEDHADAERRLLRTCRNRHIDHIDLARFLYSRYSFLALTTW